MQLRGSMSKYIPAIVVGLLVALLIGGGLAFLAAAVGADPGPIPGFLGAFLGVFVAYIMGNLAGNRRAKNATAEQKAAVLALRPEPGQALLIVFREGFVGSAAGLNLTVDGRFVAQLKSPRFTAVSVAPGGHSFTLGFGGLAAKQNRPDEEGFIAAPGQVVAYQAVMAMGALKNRVVVRRIEADEALVQRLKSIRMVAPES